MFKVDENGYGLHIRGIDISPYEKRGDIDHQNLGFDAYLRFSEDVFLEGQRIDQKTDGRPDNRLTVRESVPILGDLANDFDFSKDPGNPQRLDPFPANKIDQLSYQNYIS